MLSFDAIIKYICRKIVLLRISKTIALSIGFIIYWGCVSCPLAQLIEKDKEYSFQSPGFFDMPSAISYDGGQHRMAFADRGRNLVYIFDLSNRSSTILGDNQEIKDPVGLAFSRNGDLFISQADNSRIIIFGPNATDPDILEMSGADPSRSIHPGKLFIDQNDLLYVADQNQALIYVIDDSANLKFKIKEKLRNPNGILVNQSGEIMVADRGIDPILIFSSDGVYLRRLSPPELPTEKFSYRASGLAIDQQGQVYTLDVNTSRIVWFDPIGVNRTQWSPPPPFIPIDIAIDRYDNIYVLETSSGSARIFVKGG